MSILYSSFLYPNNAKFHFPKYKSYLSPPKPLFITCARRTKRVGKLRYPSEKKKLKLQHKTELDLEKKFEGIWRLSNLGVSALSDPGKDFIYISDALLQEIAKVLEFPVASMLPPEAFTVVRKSFDARKLQKEPKFIYTVDMDVSKLLSIEPRTWDFISELEPRAGLLEHILDSRVSEDIMGIVHSCRLPNIRKPKIGVVGSGPAGLFASLVLAEFGADVTLLERGEAVEKRGRDIGALVVRRMLEEESNFCFGEGGAGTWSDGKLVTRIGRNSSSVLAVLKTLVRFGAPKKILVDGKPHLGTDKLVPLLQNFRRHLQELGVTIKFGTRVDDLLVENGFVVGVKVSNSIDKQKLVYDAVVLAVGHSARDTYEMLLSHNVNLSQKDFSIGLRVEHPQELINAIQYSELAEEVNNGRGRVPVADYKVTDYLNTNRLQSPSPIGRNCYSFCMCPGGQVVLTSTKPSELCINGMSFSRRSSKWANAALVVTVSPNDFSALGLYGPLAGVQFQRTFEQKAALMGGGDFVVPVQRVTDFLGNKSSVASLPSSSYRLGVKAANLHELFPSHITEALQKSILMFDKELPGFISSSALLHGVETRTSSPIQISRTTNTFECMSLRGLYPVGEGAGYAGGIVSAAVDGMQAGFSLAKSLGLYEGNLDTIFGKGQSVGVAKY
ncbi:unnamed protein product [Cuscuta epithymum]|uniref:FAD-binding domain-containing protein n=1 Tax=Cuscuta epithymum TaxID=186058 RepID=A0AAV0G9A1_9ASTE|nr:unnamed protein product [Cuscuta epithymum]